MNDKPDASEVKLDKLKETNTEENTNSSVRENQIEEKGVLEGRGLRVSSQSSQHCPTVQV